MAGRLMLKVEMRQSLARSGMAIVFLSFNTTSSAHQKLATLSSNNPLPKGNILVITCLTVSGPCKRKGAHTRANVTITTMPIVTSFTIF